MEKLSISIEQKAKAYDEALKKAKDMLSYKEVRREDMEYLFPELKESEDERIRKALIDYFDDANKADENPLQSYGIHTDKAIAWLEKQDKQNPCESCEEPRLNCQNFPCEKKKNFDFSNKVEPKFKVGDFIVNDYGMVMRITGIKNDKYEFIFEDKLQSWPIVSTDRNCHLWTIQDAKDGDVLACENGWTCIFKTLVNNETFSSYCFIDNTKWFCETGSECHTLKEEFVKAYNGKTHPATKEQCEQLKKAMVDAGYVWDEEKKELKKIEQKPADWSEDDETARNDIIAKLAILKSRAVDGGAEKEICEMEINWLKSLRPQSTWKPSEDQMNALANALSLAKNCGEDYSFDLRTLYEQLKKLKD